MSWGCRTEVPTLGGFGSRRLSAPNWRPDVEIRCGWLVPSQAARENAVQASPSFRCLPEILGVPPSMSVSSHGLLPHTVCVSLCKFPLPLGTPLLLDEGPATLARPHLH